MSAYLEETSILDFHSAAIQQLIADRGWADLTAHERIGAAYDYVRNDILFGYNTEDSLPASTVLAEGFGQCNTKSTLLMALLRALDIPCRFHGFTIDKSLQRGVVPELASRAHVEKIVVIVEEALSIPREPREEGSSTSLVFRVHPGAGARCR